jgi:hypothetical protein
MAETQPPEEQEISSRVLSDENFRNALLKDPAGTLEREYGVKVPQGVKLRVHEETDEELHLIVPGRSHKKAGTPGGGGITALRPNIVRTSCCTCGSSTSQSMNSLQKGCGC